MTPMRATLSWIVRTSACEKMASPLQAGFRPQTWYSVGFDYSRTTGDATLTPDLLPSGLQLTLAAQLAQLAAAGLLPPGYQLRLPIHSVTNTFAVGVRIIPLLPRADRRKFPQAPSGPVVRVERDETKGRLAA